MKAKLHFVLSITILFCSFYGLGQQDYWKQTPTQSTPGSLQQSQEEVLFDLNSASFAKVLSAVNQNQGQSLYFPDEKGKIHSFEVWETPVLHPELSKKYPTIQSFSGRSKEGHFKIKFSTGPKGVQITLMNLDSGEMTFGEKAKGTSNTYRIYSSRESKQRDTFQCLTKDKLRAQNVSTTKNLVDDQILRKYRIAVSTTGEYTAYHGGTVSGALTAINATLTRVNSVFETDLAVTLEVVANNDQVIFIDAENDPYTGSFNAQVQSTLTSIIGEENYDVGHLFHRDNDNGNAGFIGSVCVDNRKGSAFASALIPEGDLFDLDYVAHELGHQFGANHTWSFESEGTGVQVEPGSGTTIMGYAGITGENDVAPNGDDYFHHASISQIQDYLQTTSCSDNTVLSNTPPVINPLPDYVIPAGTPFVLSGSATDVDGDMLTYVWEQIDDGVVVTSTFGPDNISGANFRSLPPTGNPERYFPRLSRVISGNLEQINPLENDAWETVSNVQREMNFALTVRDNNPSGGQVTSDSVSITVENTGGPFRITSQTANETYEAGSVQNITWDAANTNQQPINAATVSIFLSTDGGLTFPVVLANDVPNIGLAQIQLPGVASTNARVMIRANDNIFFAVNSADFTITETSAILSFGELSYSSCQPDDIITSFVYETFDGFSETMTLSVDSAQPFTASFSQNTVSANGTTIDLTLGNTANLPVGSHTLDVVANGASFSTSVTLEIDIFEGTLNDVVLTNPQDASVGVNVNPVFSWQDDPNYNAFDIEIALDETFTSIVESSTVTFASYQSANLIPETQYFWRIRPKNECGDGTFGAPFSFTTSVVNCAQFDSNDLPLEISADGTPTVMSKLFLAEDLRIADINVSLEISHTFLEDLTVTLISPAGTRVPLISKNCGSLNNVIAVFDDSGSTLSCSGNPAISGVIQPLGTLATFKGESTLGEWTLEIQDSAVSDGGSFDAFALEICVEGIFRPDDDEDGVFDDGDDLCLGTPKGTLVDTSGCPLNAFPANNFSVSIQGETCRDNNDGTISVVTMDDTLEYSGTLTGNGVNVTNQFMDTTSFSNLPAGTYQLCITGTDGVTSFRESCFDIQIDEPEQLSVLANLLADGRTVALQLTGSDFYNIELNGTLEQTTDNAISIDLEPGLNTVKVTTGLSCKGVFEKQFFVADAPILIPNPVAEWVTISSGFQNQEIMVSIYSAEGRLVKTQKAVVEEYSVEMNVSELSSGLYYVRLESGEVSQTSKMIKQ